MDGNGTNVAAVDGTRNDFRAKGLGELSPKILNYARLQLSRYTTGLRLR
jgi:hypothetical protein